jgi:hypothetical protein
LAATLLVDVKQDLLPQRLLFSGRHGAFKIALVAPTLGLPLIVLLRFSRPGDKYLAGSLEPAPSGQELGKRKGSKEAKKKAAP